MTIAERAILLCAIAASTPRKAGKIGDSGPEHCIYTARIAGELGWDIGGKRISRAIELATYARDQAAESGWVHKRTQETDAEAEAWLREVTTRLKRRRSR